MIATHNNAEWLHVGCIEYVSSVATDVIVYGNGCCLKFFNTITGAQHIMIANRHSVDGDGIKAVTGHRSVHTFAYAELARDSTLYVKEYPTLKTIVTFKDGPPEGYTSLEFSETSLLVALGNIPHFVITIWNWRTKEKLGELISNITMEQQVLRISWGTPINMVQIGTASDKLYLWDIFVCCKTAVLAKHELKFPTEQFELVRFSDCVWTVEGDLHIVDLIGCIYGVDTDFRLQKEVDVSIDGDIPTSINYYKSGLVVSGPNNEVRHYIKNGSWNCDWTLTLEVGVKHLFSNKPDYLVGITTEEEIVKLTRKKVTYLKRTKNKFNDLCMIYPTGEYVVTLRRKKILEVYNTKDGKGVYSGELNGKALAIAENPELPYVAIGYDNGVLELMSLYKAYEPSVMTSFNLTEKPIENIKFFENGRFIVAGNSDVGQFFIIEGLPGSRMNVVACVQASRQIADFMLVAAKNCYRLFLIPVNTNQWAGNLIIRYCILSKSNVNIKQYHFDSDVKFFYHQLIPTRTSTRDRIFYALPSNSRNIHILETKRGDSVIRIISEIKTGHQMRNIGLHITKHYALTWGYDGFIIVRDSKFDENVGMALPHHRYLGGVKKAYIDPLGKYIISLGRENNLICTNLVANQIDEEMQKSLTELKDSVKFALMFRRPTFGFEPEGRFEHKTWLEVEQIKLQERDEEICRTEKNAILAEFASIKNQLMDLVTYNIEGPEREQLDLQEFYLDFSLFQHKKRENKTECKNIETYLKALIVAQDKVSQHMMENYHNKMKVVGRAVYGFFAKTMTTNYTLLPDDMVFMGRLSEYQMYRKMEKFFSSEGGFMPWRILPEEDVMKLVQKPVIPQEQYTDLDLLKVIENLDGTFQLSLETQQAMAGSVTSQFVEPNPAHYYQREVTSFYQREIFEHVAEFELIKLKMHYNELFEDVLKQKYRDMAYIKEKNARLRYILSEINYFSKTRIDLEIPDPEWIQREQPEEIIRVMDYEMKVTPYISPSQQAILDAKAAEEERIRLALLADDFKDRALMKMMNGVLEVRWEDELKKDVPIPKCMLEKEPEHFNEEDLIAIRDYEENVAFLNSERERYKNLLDGEFTKISLHLRDMIRKFNSKVKHSLECKMDIDSAANEENLKVNRVRWNQKLRIDLIKKQENIECSFRETDAVIAELRRTISSLSESLQECRLEVDLHQVREKLLEKTFRKDIQDLSSLVQEQAIKIYKKKPPKVVFRHAITGAIYMELARCVANNEKSLIITEGGLNFVKALDAFDNFTGVPPTIDENTHNLICKHRRLRIEYELKLKGYQTQVTDGENAIAIYQKRLNTNREKYVRLQAEYHEVNRDYLYLTHNMQIQLVLRRGLVEVPLSGSAYDFKDAMLVPRKEIEHINQLIKEAGNKKIQAIMKNMTFRRCIMIREWNHRKLRMQINDLLEYIKDIDSVKFTREMQQYLKAKKAGRRIEDSVESELDTISQTFQHRIKDKMDKYDKLKKDIQTYKDHNTALDESIQSINVDLCDLHLQKDETLSKKESEVFRLRMDALLKRSSVVNQIQHNHKEILILQTELELLRLRTYPTFKYKVIDS